MAEPPRRFKALGLNEDDFLKNYREKIVRSFMNPTPNYMPRKGWFEKKLVTEKLWPSNVTASEMESFLNWAAKCVHGKKKGVWRTRADAQSSCCIGISPQLENKPREFVLTEPDPLQPDEFLLHVASAFSPKDEIWRLRKQACPIWPMAIKADVFSDLCNTAFSAYVRRGYMLPAFVGKNPDIIQLSEELKEELKKCSSKLDAWLKAQIAQKAEVPEEMEEEKEAKEPLSQAAPPRAAYPAKKDRSTVLAQFRSARGLKSCCRLENDVRAGSCHPRSASWWRRAGLGLCASSLSWSIRGVGGGVQVGTLFGVGDVHVGWASSRSTLTSGFGG